LRSRSDRLYVPLTLSGRCLELRPVALDWIRRRQRSLARGVLALFCLVWLQAALVPCAMALMPTGAVDAPIEHCAYCPPTTDADRDAGGDAVCTYPDAPQVDSRTALAVPLLLALPTASFVLDIAFLDLPDVPADNRLPDRAGPPLAVSYCRFLK
jgi:hypothetical protein